MVVTSTPTRSAEPGPGALRQAGGNAAGRLLGLPPARAGYTVNRVDVPMRDG
ncbi:MAG TPA: hypothetical protein VE441_00980, partial [Mycobacterium sp.]|nr:hypothetical protein [Mycobacterium sp.]